MVPIQKFLLSDVIEGAPSIPHPAFVVKGREVPEVFISKYQNIVVEGKAYSAALQRPETSIDFNGAVAACEAKGPGWHLMTRAEWAAIALWSKKNGTLPRGNNNSGSDCRFPNEKGVTYDGNRTLTGSGPATWAHDHTTEGIYGLNGNVLEWMGGVRWMNGELQVIPDNDAAAGANQGADSAVWTPIKVDGKPVRYAITEEGITLTTKKPKKDWGGCKFRDLQADFEVPMTIKALAIFPDGKHETEDRFWVDTDGERLSFAGGHWSNGSHAGVFFLRGAYPRSYAAAAVGFRSAFIPTEN
jgi:hypothetical protein